MSSAIVSRYHAARTEAASLPRGELRGIHTLDAARAARSIVAEWTAIALGVGLFAAFPHPLLYPLAVVWIGSRMLGLWVLSHEGLHHLISRDVRVNDALTRLLLAWPIFLSLSGFRRDHLRHHRHLGSAEDPESALSRYPEFRFPKTRGGLLRVLLLDACGLNFLRFRWIGLRRSLRDEGLAGWIPPPAKLLYYAVLAGVLVAFGALGWWLLLWLVPYATWFQLVLRMRLMAEHLNLPESDHFRTRTILPNALERWLFVPHNVHYHVEHHLYPAAPCYQLPKAHGLLRAVAGLGDRVPVRRGYLRMFREFELAPDGRGPGCG